MEDIERKTESDIKKITNGLSDKVEDKSTPLVPFFDFFSNLESFDFLRSPFQLFRGLIRDYLGEGVDEYPGEESIGYKKYNTEKLFEQGSKKFFASRLLTNILVELSERMVRGKQQNKIYVFIGPPGSGKSTNMDALLESFERFVNENQLYEIVWKLDTKELGVKKEETCDDCKDNKTFRLEDNVFVPCLNHCNPAFLIPREVRREFLDEVLPNTEFKHNLFTKEEYQWVFDKKMCPVCQKIFRAVGRKLFEEKKQKYDLNKILDMLFVRQYRFDRRLSQGISVFGSGDEPNKKKIVDDEEIQKGLSVIFKGDRIEYIAHPLCETNSGVLGLMDIKSYNIERFIELHNVVSEDKVKARRYEQGVFTLFLAVMNPEDKENIKDIESFLDRIVYVWIPYITDVRTEMKVYKDIFGKDVAAMFLPEIAENFTRVILASRLNGYYGALEAWLGEKRLKQYYERHLCDRDGLTLLMDISDGEIPKWLFEDDVKKFRARIRRWILEEVKTSAQEGISGRDSIEYFGKFLTWFKEKMKSESKEKEEKIRLINMDDLISFLDKLLKEIDPDNDLIPKDFLGDILDCYNERVVEQIKISLYRYNEELVQEYLLNYLFALSLDEGTTEVCPYTDTDEEITASKDFFKNIEDYLLAGEGELKRTKQREKWQEEHVRDMAVIQKDVKKILKTKLYKTLLKKYNKALKRDILEPLKSNENFGRAIKDFGTERFEIHDKKIKDDVKHMLKQLQKEFVHTEEGAQQVAEYAIDCGLIADYVIK